MAKWEMMKNGGWEWLFNKQCRVWIDIMSVNDNFKMSPENTKISWWIWQANQYNIDYILLNNSREM